MVSALDFPFGGAGSGGRGAFYVKHGEIKIYIEPSPILVAVSLMHYLFASIESFSSPGQCVGPFGHVPLNNGPNGRWKFGICENAVGCFGR